MSDRIQAAVLLSCDACGGHVREDECICANCKPASSLRSAYEARGPKALIDACSGSNHCDRTSLWAAAMTALYGPTGLHQDWADENGHPSAECLAKLPDVALDMARARERIEVLLARIERDERIAR